MFQPMPTPAASYELGVIANANNPEYIFTSTVLGRSGGSGGRDFESSRPGAAHVFDAQPFYKSNPSTQTTDSHYSRRQRSSKQDTSKSTKFGGDLTDFYRGTSYGSVPQTVPRRHSKHQAHHSISVDQPIKMENANDLAAQEAAARDFDAQPEVSTADSSLLFPSPVAPPASAHSRRFFTTKKQDR
jgi:hypothetical protein